MRFTAATTLIALAATTVHGSAINFDCFAQSGCNDYQTTIETDVSDGSCNQIPGLQSIRTQSVKGGCSLTVYTDSSCSSGAIVAGVGACILGASIFSYSVDC